MAFQKGTAASHKDLLAKLRTFATANGWTSTRFDSGANQETELVLSSTGLTNDDNINLIFRTNTLSDADAYNIRCKAAPVYIPSPFENVTGASPESVLYAWNSDMEYYFIVSKDRIMVLFTVSGTSQYYYGGNLQVYTSRGHWVNPLCCFGVGTNKDARWSSQGDDYSGWQYIRGSNPCHIRDDTGVWDKPNFMYPNMDTNLMDNMRPYGNDDVPLMNMLVATAKRGVVGEIQGAYGCPGFGVSHGQEITQAVTNRKFVILQNVYRAGTHDYMAMELA